MLCLAVTPVRAVPPLTEPEQRQIEMARDRTDRIDNDAALYPLLRHVMQWTPGDEAGAAVPDFDGLTETPEAHRGDLFLIEGLLVRTQPFRPADQDGPWAERLSRWDIMIGAKPDERVISVLLVAPPADARVRSRVRLPARSSKVYTDRNINNQKRDYPVCVGHSAAVVGREAPGSDTTWLVAVALVAMMAFAFYIVRRWVSASKRLPPLATRIIHERNASRGRDREDDDNDEADTATPLPKDPVAALDELARRRAEDEASR